MTGPFPSPTTPRLPVFASTMAIHRRKARPPPTPSVVDVMIEVPQWSFVKRKGDGSIDYVAPLPSPFPGYGSVPDSLADDGVWRARGGVHPLHRIPGQPWRGAARAQQCPHWPPPRLVSWENRRDRPTRLLPSSLTSPLVAGDPLDAIVLGQPCRYGELVRGAHVRGVLRFTDAGAIDNKVMHKTCPAILEFVLERELYLYMPAIGEGNADVAGLERHSWGIGGV